MFYASDIIGKKVISLYESEFIGTVCNIYYNKKRTKVVVFEIFNNEETRMFLNVHDIFNIGQAISIKSKFNSLARLMFSSIESYSNNIGIPSFIIFSPQ